MSSCCLNGYQLLDEGETFIYGRANRKMNCQLQSRMAHYELVPKYFNIYIINNMHLSLTLFLPLSITILVFPLVS